MVFGCMLYVVNAGVLGLQLAWAIQPTTTCAQPQKEDIMARSLEGKTFFVAYNNGVTAIATEAVLENRDKRLAIINALQRDNKPLRDVSQVVGKGLGHLPDVPI